MILSLICHAATPAVRDACFPRDEALDTAGNAACAALAGRLRRVDAALTSPSLRARQTAAALGLAPEVAPALREIDYGRWAGRSLADVGQSDPEAAAAWLSDPEAAPHGGESLAALQRRVAAWLAAWPEDERRVAAITHASVLRAALVCALAADPASFWRIDVAPLARLRLRGGGGRWTLLSLGRW